MVLEYLPDEDIKVSMLIDNFGIISQAGADQCSSHRRGADFPGGVHWCAALTKGADRAVVYSSSAIFEFFWGVLENVGGGGGAHPLHPTRKSAPDRK